LLHARHAIADALQAGHCAQLFVAEWFVHALF
jgi:hypothetical protein